MAGPIKLAHIWSSDMGAVLSLPYLRHFLRRGWQVHVLCPEGPRLELVRAAGVRLRTLPLSRRLVDPAGDAVTAWRIWRQCREEKFHIVHTHNIKAGLIGRVAAGLSGGPSVVHTMHGMPFSLDSPGPKRLGHTSLEWIACRFADRVLVQSRGDGETLLRSRVIAPEKVVYVGNGTDLSRFDPGAASRGPLRQELGLSSTDVLFLSAGRLVKEKGFVELAEATALAKKQNPRIQVAIAGPRDTDKADCLTDDQLERARRAGVRFLGERDDMPGLYAAADVVVLPSWREGLPRVLIEGAAMAKPLLATDVRGCREVVVEGQGGYLVPLRAPDLLAQGMVRLAGDAATREAFGLYNRRRALEQYDLGSVIEKVASIYEQLLAQTPR